MTDALEFPRVVDGYLCENWADVYFVHDPEEDDYLEAMYYNNDDSFMPTEELRMLVSVEFCWMLDDMSAQEAQAMLDNNHIAKTVNERELLYRLVNPEMAGNHWKTY